MKVFRQNKLLTAFVAILLVLALMVNVVSVSATGENGSTSNAVYLYDLQIFQGGSIDECVQLCEKAGYIPFRENLNEGAIEKVRFGFNRTAPCVMIGYKTTEDKSMAVTDLSMLRMNTGYKIQDYQTIASAMLARNQGVAESMAAAAAELAVNYEKGSPAAHRAIEILDILYVEDLEVYTYENSISRTDNSISTSILLQKSETVRSMLDKMGTDYNEREPFGEYILNGKADSDFFAKLMSFGSLSIINSINSIFAAGLPEYLNCYNDDTGEYETNIWASRIADSDLAALWSKGLTFDELRELDKLYMDRTKTLVPVLQSFATMYLNAKARNDSITLPDYEAENIDDVVQNLNNVNENDLDWIYLSTYETLSQYPYDSRRTLADWFVEMGRKTYIDEKDYRELYVLADILTAGQCHVLSASGLPVLAGNMLQTEAALAKTDELLGEMKNTFKTMTGYEKCCLSIWDGIDINLYSGSIAMTDKAVRDRAAQTVIDRESEEEFRLEQKNIRNLYFTIFSSSISAIGLIFTVLEGIKSIHLLIVSSSLTVAECGSFWAFVSSASSTLGHIGLIIMLAALLIRGIIWLVDVISEELEIPSEQYQEMPTQLIDTKQTGKGSLSVKYYAVWEPYRGRIADLNAYEGNSWNSLYVSHDKMAGSPIMADENGIIFRRQVNDPSLPSGYKAMSIFGNISPDDLNEGVYELKNDETVYLFYHTEKTLGLVENEGEKDNSDNTYIASLKIETGRTAESVKATLTKQGLYVFDLNLGTNDAPSYLGYTLTNSPDAAVKDIRMATLENSAENFRFGEVSYACAGTLASGDSLYYTSSASSGSPIHSGLKKVSSLKDAPEGWEPVVFMSGAPVYYFGGNKFALYFEPDVKYTSGQQYIAGLYFVSSVETDTNLIDFEEEMNGLANVSKDAVSKSLINLINLEERFTSAEGVLSVTGRQKGGFYGNSNLLKGITAHYSPKVNVQNVMHLGYMLTYNPKRAIRDVALYMSTYKNDVRLDTIITRQLLLNLNGVEKTVSGSYAACDNVLTEQFMTMYNSDRSSGNNHAFISKSIAGRYYDSYMPPQQDGFDYAWKQSEIAMKGLYVLGTMADMPPLTPDDIIISKTGVNAVNTDGNIGAVMNDNMKTLGGKSAQDQVFRSIQEFKNPYALGAQNLAMPALSDKKGNGLSAPGDNLYIYLKGSVRKPRYISGINVGAYSKENYLKMSPDTDKDILELVEKVSEDSAWRGALSGASGELIPVNLSVEQKNAWYSKTKSNGCADKVESSDTAYIAVSRTDDVSKAIRGVNMVKSSALKLSYNSDSKILTPANDINIYSKNTPDFHHETGSAAVKGVDGEYFLYTSLNSGAIPGFPITDIVIDDSVYKAGTSTSLMSDKINGPEPYGDSTLKNYIHCRYESNSGAYINKIYIGTGKDLDSAMGNALSQGCPEIAVVDINRESGDALVIGYRSFAADENDLALHKNRRGTASDPLREAIRDIILTTDEPYQNMLIHNNAVYRPVSKTSLNEGVDGSEIYMYACCDNYTRLYNDSLPAEEKLPVPSQYSDLEGAITKVGFAVGDRVPYNTSLEGNGEKSAVSVCWENVLTNNDSRLDLNEGSIKTDKDSLHILDNRMYMFVHRENNRVKRGAEITGGYLDDYETVGAVYKKTS